MQPGTYLPCEALKPYVKIFTIQETADKQVFKVLPGTEVVIGFQYKGNLSYLDKGTQIPLSSSGVTGINDSFRIFKNTAGTGSVLVFFTETGAAPFFKQPLHEIFRESVSLDNFMLRSELLLVEEQLCEAAEAADKIKVIENFLLSRLTPSEPDALVMAALSLIHKAKGNIRIADLAAQLYTSQSPLEKRFRKKVGATPKKIASIIRLKNAIQQYESGTSLTALSYETGFYDQAHFIKEFRTFTGDTPESYFASKD